jgi:hypothetical protein
VVFSVSIPNGPGASEFISDDESHLANMRSIRILNFGPAFPA